MSFYMKVYIVLMIYQVFGTNAYRHHEHKPKLKEVFSWKQLSYDFDGFTYDKNTDKEAASDSKPDNSSGTDSSEAGPHPSDPERDAVLPDSEKFFIQYNNVPIGFEVHESMIFITVPRRRHGIPSTLNYAWSNCSSPHLRPYPDTLASKKLVSVYRPRVDVCGRLWVVDTGLLEVPGERRQVQPPAIVVFDLETRAEVLRHELQDALLVNERTPGGLTSITVDAAPDACDEAFAYITDLATSGLIVYSLKDRRSWRIEHSTFAYDSQASNFSVAGNTIDWKDGLFSVALTERDADGKRSAYYHPLVSTQEFAIDTTFLREDAFSSVKKLGERGVLSQSGSHDYHVATRTMLLANVAQDAIQCWNIDTELTPDSVALVAQDHRKLLYISDLKVVGDEVWVLVNQIPRFVYSTLDPNENNYYIHRGNVQDLIRGTVCDQTNKK